MLKKKKIINDFERSSITYFKEIGAFSPLSREEEYSLWEQYKKNNDLSARDKIIKSNLKFVANVAKPYIGRGLSYSDLIAEGNCGLMRAMEKFDYTKGYKTISYSVWWIRQAILEALEERNGLDADELPQDFEKPIECEAEGECCCTDKDSQYDNEFISENNKESDNNETIKALLSILTDREKFIIVNYYGLENNEAMTLEEVGNELGLTKERVRQILEKALKKMRSEALNNFVNTTIY